MKSKGLFFVLILSLAVNASVAGALGYNYFRSAFAGKEVPCPISPAHQHLFQELGLSSSQLAQVEPLAQKFHARVAELESAMKGKNESFIETLRQKDVDPGQVEALRREMAGIQDDIQKEVIGHILDFKKILDPKQQEQFFALMRQGKSVPR